MDIRVDAFGNPILEQFSEEGFIDCVLKIEDVSESDTGYRFHLSASHNGEVVGFDVAIVKGIKGGFDSDMNLIQAHVYWEGVKFFRSGSESDRLISALARLYGFAVSDLKMVDSESFTGIALHQGDIDMAVESVKIKLFGNDSESDCEEDYYESFFTLDLSNGFVFWNEKDQDYREPLIRSLSKSSA